MVGGEDGCWLAGRWDWLAEVMVSTGVVEGWLLGGLVLRATR